MVVVQHLHQALYVGEHGLVDASLDTCIDGIRAETAERAQRFGLTGALIVTKTGFAQMLEGQPADVEKCLSVLQADPHHTNALLVEERTVGPDLGADSIRKGLIAFLIGTIALMTFMIVTYGRFGVYTCIALILNTLMILGIMAVANTTLTLPGIAGFVLTIGAAVDANVLINERIREERARGRRVMQALEHGYTEARSAIFDGNITNVIAAILMFLFGSGPIKGFAVVLIIGIATSVFTAVSLTRMWVANWARKTRPNDLVL